MNVFKKLYFLFLTQTIVCTHGFAQRVSYTQYNTRDGLAASNVYCITQDKDGYIWFGTETGISRFDGTRFRNFSVVDGLMGNEVFSVFTDSRNRVWMMCFDNEICYYYKGKIYNRRNDATLAKIKPKGIISVIAENESGEIFIENKQGIYVLSDSILKVAEYVVPNKLTNNHIDNFNAVAGTGSIYVSMADVPGYVKRHVDPWTIANIPIRTENPYDEQLPYYVCYQPFVEKKNKSLYLFNEKDTLGKTIAIPEETVNMIKVSGSVYAFLRTHNGVTLYDVVRQQSKGDFLAGYVVQYVMQDKEQNLWFATKGAGVIKMSHALFRNYTFDSTGVCYIQPLSGKLLIGTDNGSLWKMPPLKDISYSAALDTRLVSPETGLAAIAGEADNKYVNCASADFLRIEKQLKLVSVKSLQINQGTILAATSFNCVLIDLKTRHITDTLYHGRTTCAYYDHGKYYIGTLTGLVEVNREKKITFLGERYPVLKSQINQISSQEDGMLWIATSGSGVIGYKDGRIITNIRLANGLTSDLCRCLYIHGNTIWVGTDKGLNKISCSNGAYTVTGKFTSADGLNADLINAIYSNGTLVYAGTPLGLTIFDDTQIPQQSPCKLVLDHIIVSGNKINPSQKDTVFSYRDHNIRFNYDGISFLSEGSIYYRYRLLGLNDQWETTKENHLDYPALSSGKYTLQLQAVNKLGNKSNLVEYSFEIEKKITERIWFQITLLLAFVVLTTSIIKLMVKRSHRKEQEKIRIAQKVVELEQMALRAQMNPHFIFNCLNSMQHYIINQDIKSTNFLLTRFARLVRQTLNNSSRINITIEEEVSYLSNYLELERLQVCGSFNYLITVSGLIDQQKMLIPNMVLQPYVENAVKHGVTQIAQGGFILIEFRLPEKNMLECIIEDNGPGIHIDNSKKPEAEKKQAHGMSITDKRIKTLDQLNPQHPAIYLHVENRSRPDNSIKGTRVTIRFPV